MMDSPSASGTRHAAQTGGKSKPARPLRYRWNSMVEALIKVKVAIRRKRSKRGGSSLLDCQLPTGRVDVLAAASADVGNNTFLPEECGKAVNFVFRCIDEIRIGNRVVFNDVYLAGHVFAECSKFLCIGQPIVKIMEDNVFVGDGALCFGVKIL